MIRVANSMLQKGDLYRLAIGVIAVIIFAVAAVLVPEHRYISLFWVLVGLCLTWREYQAWRHIREQYKPHK